MLSCSKGMILRSCLFLFSAHLKNFFNPHVMHFFVLSGLLSSTMLFKSSSPNSWEEATSSSNTSSKFTPKWKLFPSFVASTLSSLHQLQLFFYLFMFSFYRNGIQNHVRLDKKKDLAKFPKFSFTPAKRTSNTLQCPLNEF